MYFIWWQSLKTVSPWVANDLSRGNISRFSERSLLDDVSIWISSVRTMAFLQFAQVSFNLLRVWLEKKNQSVNLHSFSCLEKDHFIISPFMFNPETGEVNFHYWQLIVVDLRLFLHHDCMNYLSISHEMGMKSHKFVIIKSDFTMENNPSCTDNRWKFEILPSL